jgi:quinoprotein glucose dehydrogenase
MSRSGCVHIAACFVLACSIARGQAAPASADEEWRAYGHDPGGMRFSSLTQINPSNVQRLRRVWTYHTGETSWSSIKQIAPFETSP